MILEQKGVQSPDGKGLCQGEAVTQYLRAILDDNSGYLVMDPPSGS